MENKRKLGSNYEQKAVEYLLQKGYAIIECNYRNRSGEIDIVARDHAYICFIEVKYRATDMYGNPLEAVTPHKQNQIRKVARFYLMTHGMTEWTPCRFDVIAFEGENITHIENAF